MLNFVNPTDSRGLGIPFRASPHSEYWPLEIQNPTSEYCFNRSKLRYFINCSLQVVSVPKAGILFV